MSEQLEQWRGRLGDAYIARNQLSEVAVLQVTACWERILPHTPSARSILEVGANVGRNLAALSSLTEAELYAVEPNRAAREALGALLPADRIREGHAGDLPFANGSIDLVFTSGVLIHIPEGALREAYSEIHRVAARWILSIEYFSPRPAEVVYQGRSELLWKRDYGSYWLDWFDDLRYVADGFFWKRTTGLDDLNWWLFRKI